MTKTAQKTIEVLSRPQYAGNLDVAFLYNMAAAILGQPTVTFPVPVTEGLLRDDVREVMKQPAWAYDFGLTEILAA